MPVLFHLSDELQVEVPCYEGLNLLAHAQLEELEIGSRCGGQGVCGGDRVQVRCSSPGMELSPVTEAEIRHLSPDELKQGWRLACQCFPSPSAGDKKKGRIEVLTASPRS